MRWRLRFYPTIGHRRKGWLWQTFSRQSKREMLLVTVRSFVCQLVGCLGRRAWLDSEETVRNMTRTAVINRCRRFHCSQTLHAHPGLNASRSSIWLLALLSSPFLFLGQSIPNFGRDSLREQSRAEIHCRNSDWIQHATRFVSAWFSTLVWHYHKVSRWTLSHRVAILQVKI